MSVLSLNPSSRSILTRTVVSISPTDPTDRIVVSYPCDLNGNQIAATMPGLPVYRDTYTGESYVRVAEVMPSGMASVDVDTKNALLALNPVHFVSSDGEIKGWFVIAPDFNKRENGHPLGAALDRAIDSAPAATVLQTPSSGVAASAPVQQLTGEHAN